MDQPPFFNKCISISNRKKVCLPNSSPSFTALQLFLKHFFSRPCNLLQKPRTTTTTRAWCSAKDPTCNSAKVPSQPNDLNSHSPSSAIFFLRWDFQELDPQGNPTQPFQEQKQQKTTNLGAFKIHPSPIWKHWHFFQVFVFGVPPQSSLNFFYPWVRLKIRTRWRCYPPEKLTCPQKRTILKGHFIFQPSIFGGYVGFQGGTYILASKAVCQLAVGSKIFIPNWCLQTKHGHKSAVANSYPNFASPAHQPFGKKKHISSKYLPAVVAESGCCILRESWIHGNSENQRNHLVLPRDSVG